MSNFDLNAILRGIQMTLVGAHRSLQNPAIFQHQHYRQAALAVVAGIGIRMLLEIPALIAHFLIAIASLVTDLDSAQWDDDIIKGLHFLQHTVLQVPFFLMSLMRLLSPALDNMFMESLEWVDKTYASKHEGEDSNDLRPMYYPNLALYSSSIKTDSKEQKRKNAAIVFIQRSLKKAGISLAVYFASYLPLVGRFVLPAASFYTFHRAVGPKPAIAIFSVGLFLPKHYLVAFLQTFFSSRSLMRQLLSPYMSRIKFSSEQKRLWMRDREGVLFGFGIGFFTLIKIPLVGVLAYGIAEASTAYLVTKITEPPPPPSEIEKFRESEIKWDNKHKFLSMPISDIDSMVTRIEHRVKPTVPQEGPRKKFA